MGRSMQYLCWECCGNVGNQCWETSGEQNRKRKDRRAWAMHVEEVLIN